MKQLSDRDLKVVSFFFGLFMMLMFTRFGGREFGLIGSGSMTSSFFSSMLLPDVLIFCAGWFAILLFMWSDST